jgi:hypothetical protein
MTAFRILLDLGEVTLVDVEVVRFLSDCENEGVVLVHCPPYVREWILRERAEGAQSQVRIAPDSFVCVRTIEQGDVVRWYETNCLIGFNRERTGRAEGRYQRSQTGEGKGGAPDK